ncbi:MAG: DUF4184 family protein [Planctomycetales bacterium]|nr:DUF4184 family protein [Planctomycetales bacterium]
MEGSDSGRWGTLLFPGLNTELDLAGLVLPVYKVVQYGSTLVGLPLLMLMAVIAVCRAEPEPRNDVLVPTIGKWFAALVVTTTPVAVGGYAVYVCATPYQMLGFTITRSIAVLITLAVLYAMWFQITFGKATIDGRRGTGVSDCGKFEGHHEEHEEGAEAN